MTLQSSGAISFQDINVELSVTGVTSTQLAPIDQAPFRALAGKPVSGSTISVSDFYGKQYRVTVNLTLAGGNVLDYDVFANRGPTYLAGISDLIVTVPAPTVVGTVSTGNFAMLVPNAFPAGDTVTIINNGTIIGAGGAGGVGGTAPGLSPFVPPGAGAGAGGGLYVNRTTTVINNGTVAGGGGGGGGSAGATFVNPRPTKSGGPQTFRGGGAGGGGGAGLNSGGGGTGGGPSGNPGSAGTVPAGGAGGAARLYTPAPFNGTTAAGGTGGGQGAAGVAAGAGGGAAGNYITGNPFVTWPVTGTRLGGVA